MPKHVKRKSGLHTKDRIFSQLLRVDRDLVQEVNAFAVETGRTISGAWSHLAKRGLASYGREQAILENPPLATPTT